MTDQISMPNPIILEVHVEPSLAAGVFIDGAWSLRDQETGRTIGNLVGVDVTYHRVSDLDNIWDEPPPIEVQPRSRVTVVLHLTELTTFVNGVIDTTLADRPALEPGTLAIDE